ncbi:DAK2 domain-containing protein [Paenibacillus thalictri]|uniref:DAK2 domain-containing protein n=1 Tax=Paenibacillus thalictri TaxID=2527873 RepID=A0A4Q9DTA9_9BACL|nr:DAK2 domain-containing protein [Paenibacillus thalictri]TBL78344.1 DAK2 domain-containing protein [Paenibacillus thalictri]
MGLSKRLNQIDGNIFFHMVASGAQHLKTNVEKVNALNVFPVPDGDTGTNMNLTIMSGVEELNRRRSGHIGSSAEAFAKGLLMGARGNSGVILSQLFRGFAKAVQGKHEIDSQQFAAALQMGVDMAYKAHARPVEGTILTVSREAAKHAGTVSRRVHDVPQLMKETVRKGYEALARTPDYLPVLKQVGVVDAGGQGLMFIYEGFMAALDGDPELWAATDTADTGRLSGSVAPAAAVGSSSPLPGHPRRVQAMLATADIEMGYCTEFMIQLAPGKSKGPAFDEERLRAQLLEHGDSLLVVADDDLVKIHIHAEYPGNVMNLAMQYGELTRIKIENMREQHTHILREEAQEHDAEIDVAPEVTFVHAGLSGQATRKPFGFVAVSAGQGISEMFRSLGVDEVMLGGQTMNPSTEDIAGAVGRVAADTVFVLPNNSNIVMAAGQVKDVISDKTVIVIPSKSIPQGIAAVLRFQEQSSSETNAEQMQQAMSRVRSGQVTTAVRDTQLDGIEIKQGDYIGLLDGRIVAAHPDLLETCGLLLEELMADGAEVIDVYTGEDAREDHNDRLAELIGERFPDAELQLHEGGQPLYPYIFSAE